MAFADLPKNRDGPSRRFLGPHIFDHVCIANDIEHRLTKPNHRWTNGQAERMNRTIKDATVKTYHYDDLESLKAHVLAFVTAYNFAKHLKVLRWRTPYQVIRKASTYLLQLPGPDWTPIDNRARSPRFYACCATAIQSVHAQGPLWASQTVGDQNQHTGNRKRRPGRGGHAVGHGAC